MYVDEINSLLNEFSQISIIIGATEKEKEKLNENVRNDNFHVIGEPHSKVTLYQMACDYLILPNKKNGNYGGVYH